MVWYLCYVCALCVCVCIALHTFFRLSVDRKIFQLFYFSGKVFLYFFLQLQSGEKFCIFVEFFARFYSNLRLPHSFSLPLFYSLSWCRHNKYSLGNMFSEVFYAVLCVCVCILLSANDWFIVCLSVSFYFVLLVSFPVLYSLIEVQVYFFISLTANTIIATATESFEFHAHDFAS